MPEIGLIDAGDVKLLTDVQLTHVCNMLIHYELGQAGIPVTAADLTQSITVSDGGLDARCAWTGEPQRAGLIPSRLSGFQYKATPMGPAACADELQVTDKTRLKPEIEKLFQESGTYILVSGTEEPTVAQKTSRFKKMRERVKGYLPDAIFQMEIWGAREISSWASGYLPAIGYIARCVGRPHLSSMKTIAEVLLLRAYENRFVDFQELRSIRSSIAKQLREPGSAFRLDGLPGLGKTRLVLETFREDPDTTARCLYIDAATQSVSDALPAIVLNWKRQGTSGVLVVDNCSRDLHETIETEIYGSNISVLTIDYKLSRMRSETPYIALGRRSPEEISEIIQAEFGSAFGSIGLRSIVNYSGGWPLVALRLARTFREHGDFVQDVPDSMFMSRMLGIQEGETDSNRVIRTLSLFEHVGFEAPYGGDLEYIREKLCESIDQGTFYGIIRHFRDRGVLVEIGSLLRVTPPPIALHLATEWLRAYHPLSARLFDPEMPPRLADYLCRQFEHLDSLSEARAIAGKLLAVGGLIGNYDALANRRGARIFRSVAKVDPATALETLIRVFMPMSTTDLLEYTQGRRDIVFALEALIYPNEFFIDATHVLAKLSAAENEALGNNATGVLRERFQVTGSQSEADASLRVAVLDEMLSMRDESMIEVAINCIRGALSLNFPVGSRWIEPPSINRPVLEWQPSKAEGNAYLVQVLERAKYVCAEFPSMATVMRSVVAGSIRGLIGRGLMSELSQIIITLNDYSDRPWKEAIDALRAAVRYEASANDELRIEVERLLTKVMPSDLESQLRLVVTSPPFDYEVENGRPIDRGFERVAALAGEIIASDRVAEAVDYVVRGQQQRGIEFGKLLYQGSDNDEAVLKQIIKRTSETDKSVRNVGVLAGALAALAESSRSDYEEVIEQIARDSDLVERLCNIIAIVVPSDWDIALLIRLLKSGAIQAESLEALAYGSALTGCSNGSIAHLLDALAEHQGFKSVYAISSMQVVANPENWNIYRSHIMRSILNLGVITCPLDGFQDFSVIEDLKRLLREPENGTFAVSVARELFFVAKTNLGFDASRRLSDVMPDLFGIHREAVLPLFIEAFASGDDVERYRLLQVCEFTPRGTAEYRSVLDELSDDDILRLCESFPTVFPAHIAQTAALFVRDADGEFQPSRIAMLVFRSFGSNKDVQEAVEANLMSFSSVGPRSPAYEIRARFIKRVSDITKGPVRNWLKLMQRRFEHIAQDRAKRDAEFEGGAW